MMPISAKYKSDLQTLENCVDSGQFDRPMMEELFTIADEMAKVKPGSKDSLMLQGYLMSTLFYERPRVRDYRLNPLWEG